MTLHPTEKRVLLVFDGGEKGLAFAQIRERLKDLSDTALRYRLRLLRERGLLQTQGTTRALRYRLTESGRASVRDVPQEHVESSQDLGSYAFTRASMGVLRELERPSHERPISRYEPEFLVRLASGACLEEGTLARLHELGDTGRMPAPAGTYARQVHERLLIDLSFASSALEGNTYSLLDTKRLIEQGVEASGKGLAEAQMILNHKRAIEFLLSSGVSLGLRRMVVMNLHAELMDNLLSDPSQLGRIRQRSVGIHKSTYLPETIPSRISEGLETMLSMLRQDVDPFEASFALLVGLSYLQPFLDGNKRTARLCANLPLFERNLRPLSFIDVPRPAYLQATLAAYEFQDITPMRELFVFAYERSVARYPDVLETLEEPDPFRLQHRALLGEVVGRVVLGLPEDLEAEVEREASSHFEEARSRARFVGMVLTELAGLHEGNFLRFGIRPSEFEKWLVSQAT